MRTHRTELLRPTAILAGPIKLLQRFVRGGGNGISEAGIQYSVGGSMILGISGPAACSELGRVEPLDGLTS